MEIPRGGICKDVLHVVADPDIQIRGGRGGYSHPDPEISGKPGLKKIFFVFLSLV